MLLMNNSANLGVQSIRQSVSKSMTENAAAKSDFDKPKANLPGVPNVPVPETLESKFSDTSANANQVESRGDYKRKTLTNVRSHGLISGTSGRASGITRKEVKLEAKAKKDKATQEALKNQSRRRGRRR